MFESIVLPVLIIAGVGLLFSLILALAYRFFSVKTNEKTEEILAALPGANCGGCGFSGCEQYAAAISEKGEKTSLCPVGGEAVAKQLAQIMGAAYERADQRRAFVACNGGCSAVKDVSIYKGIPSCKACNDMFLGKKECKYGCLGLGDCMAACPFEAIRMEDGIAVIDHTRCTGCGSCVSHCPKHLIRLAGENVRIFVACSNKDKGGVTRKVCKDGCIGCKKCEKTCPEGAISVDDFCAVIDRTKCTQCGRCRDVCPTGAIVKIERCGTIVGAGEEETPAS